MNSTTQTTHAVHVNCLQPPWTFNAPRAVQYYIYWHRRREGHWFVPYFSLFVPLLTRLMLASIATGSLGFAQQHGRHEVTKDTIEMLLQTVPDAQDAQGQIASSERQPLESPGRISPKESV